MEGLQRYTISNCVRIEQYVFKRFSRDPCFRCPDCGKFGWQVKWALMLRKLSSEFPWPAALASFFSWGEVKQQWQSSGKTSNTFRDLAT